jgi:hypothetical protein
MTASKQSQAGNAGSFGHLLCPLSGVFYCTFGTGKFHAGFNDRFQAVSGLEAVIKTCMKLSNVECKLENS